MFMKAIIHYPEDEAALAQISKEITDFRCDATVNYIKSLNLNDRQTETLYDSLETEISLRKSKTA